MRRWANAVMRGLGNNEYVDPENYDRLAYVWTRDEQLEPPLRATFLSKLATRLSGRNEAVCAATKGWVEGAEGEVMRSQCHALLEACHNLPSPVGRYIKTEHLCDIKSGPRCCRAAAADRCRAAAFSSHLRLKKRLNA